MLRFSAEPWGIRLKELRMTWNGAPPAVVGLYFGSAPLTTEEKTVGTSLELPFWPRWTAEGYCVPSGKGSPVQSFFRNWDMGQATSPLGSSDLLLGPLTQPRSHGPCLARPWEGATAGSRLVPEQSPTPHYLYREDLWGAAAGHTRVWCEPLRVAWAMNTCDAFNQLLTLQEYSIGEYITNSKR